jgi:hypothetical protein
MYRYKWWLALALAGVLVILMTAGIVSAATSPSFNLTPNSLAGSGGGGGIAKSTSYVLVVGLGSFVQTSSASTSYSLCSGFVCGGGDPFLRLGLPLLSKAE